MSTCPCPDPTELPWSLCWFLAQLVFNRQLSVGISTLHCEVIPAGIQQGIQGYSYNSFGLTKLNPKSGHHTGNNLCAALSARALSWNGTIQSPPFAPRVSILFPTGALVTPWGIPLPTGPFSCPSPAQGFFSLPHQLLPGKEDTGSPEFTSKTVIPSP